MNNENLMPLIKKSMSAIDIAAKIAAIVIVIIAVVVACVAITHT